MKKEILLTTLVGALSWACLNGPSPTGSTELPGLQSVQSDPPQAPPVGGAPPGVVPPTPTQCEQIKLLKSSIKSEVDCLKGARFYLEAPGATYFNVHLEGLNSGKILGPNVPGQWSNWYYLPAGKYTYTVAAETKVDGKVIQCDHHNKRFKIPECPKPPECPKGAFIDVQVQRVPPNAGNWRYVRWAYRIDYWPSSLDVTVNLPSECSGGICKFPRRTSTYVLSASCSFEGVPCTSDSETIKVKKCKP